MSDFVCKDFNSTEWAYAVNYYDFLNIESISAQPNAVHVNPNVGKSILDLLAGPASVVSNAEDLVGPNGIVTFDSNVILKLDNSNLDEA